jgi:hypothetical protein
VRKHGLTAAGLLLASAALLVASAGGHADVQLSHTCSATDKAFITTASTNVSTVNLWAQEYLGGDARPADVIEQANRAATIVRKTEPRDPSLSQTRTLLNAMFTEYARAVQAKARKRDAGPHIYRAYGLANFAHDVLVSAGPGLKAHGCDVAPLL